MESAYDADDRLSQRSGMSALSSKSNVILLNPDGTLMTGFRSLFPTQPNSFIGIPEGDYVKKKQEEADLQNVQPYSQTVYIVDNDEVIFYGDANEIPNYFDEFVKLFLYHKKMFTIAVCAAFLLEVLFGILGYLTRQETTEQLQLIYPGAAASYLYRMLEFSLTADAAFTVIYYTMGIVAICMKSTKLLSAFTGLSLAGLIIQMILAYLSKFNIMVFLIRFFLLIYARFLNHIMISLILIPRAVQQTHHQYSTFANT